MNSNMEEIGKYYLGNATEEQIQNQSYINGLICNMIDKPTELNFVRGYNVFIVPNTWGMPNIIDGAGFAFSSFSVNELGITAPEGKAIYVYESGGNCLVNIKSWQI